MSDPETGTFDHDRLERYLLVMEEVNGIDLNAVALARLTLQDPVWALESVGGEEGARALMSESAAKWFIAKAQEAAAGGKDENSSNRI
jgi:hypothetical protein